MRLTRVHIAERALLRTLVATAVFLSLTCKDSPFEPGMEVTASFDVQQLLSAAQEASIPIDSVNTVDYDFQWVAENGVRLTDRWTREVFTLPR